MAHLSADARQTIQPVPIVSIEAVQADPKPLERDDDSFRPVTGPDGFASDADAVRVSGVPWEQRPLSRGGVLGWTISAMVGMVAIVTTVAVALSHNASSTGQAAASHGAEPTDVANAAQPALPRADLPAKAAATTHARPAVIQLESLPKVQQKVSPKVKTGTSLPKTAARAALKASSTTASKRRAPIQTTIGAR